MESLIHIASSGSAYWLSANMVRLGIRMRDQQAGQRQSLAVERVSRLDEALRAIAEPCDEALFHSALLLENVRCFFLA